MLGMSTNKPEVSIGVKHDTSAASSRHFDSYFKDVLPAYSPAGEESNPITFATEKPRMRILFAGYVAFGTPPTLQTRAWLSRAACRSDQKPVHIILSLYRPYFPFSG